MILEILPWKLLTFKVNNTNYIDLFILIKKKLEKNKFIRGDFSPSDEFWKENIVFILFYYL